jgi:hypothetical protein|nr:MAG TPA: hypothetical protein [Caudoviricetes sp.]
MIKENEAREYRKELLEAFDTYKINVQYGIEKETDEEHKKIIKWYISMLDLPLEIEVYKNSPEKIKKYLSQLR